MLSTRTASNNSIEVFGSYVPQTLEDWMKICEYIADSSLCPTSYKGKPGDVFVAAQMGADLGLKPMQAIQNIAVINGRPCIWGDAALAVARSHKDFENIEETLENNGELAVCIVYRRGNSPVRREFSRKDAELAGLWGKQGPWKTYPTRMLQMRARGFALRDAFPDALRGISITEEVKDYEIDENGTYVEKPKTFRSSINVLPIKDIVQDFIEIKQKIENSTTRPELKETIPLIKFFKGDKIKLDELRKIYNEKRDALILQQSQENELNQMENDHESV